MNPLAMQLEDSEVKGEMFKEVVRKRQNSSNELPVIKVLSSTTDGKLCGVIDALIYLEWNMDAFRESSYNFHVEDAPSLCELIVESSMIYKVVGMGPMKNWPLEQEKHFSVPSGGPYVHLPERKFWIWYDMVSTVEYAKTFWFMSQLYAEDKILLLQNVVLNCQNLNQAFYSLQKKCENTVFPDGSSPPERPECAWEVAKNIRRTQRVIISSLIRSEMDRQDYVLLKAICLCNPSVTGLSLKAQKILAEEKDKYSLALFKHCMVTRGTAKGPGHYQGILGIVDVLEHQQRNQKDFHLLTAILEKRRFTKPSIFNDIMGR